MDAVELKNRNIIYKLVKNHFSLIDKSVALFKHRLYYDRPIAKEYKEILKNSRNLRTYFNLTEDIAERLDQGWDIFCKSFGGILNHLNIKITYSDFLKNKVKYKNQNIKLQKFLKNKIYEALPVFTILESKASESVIYLLNNAYSLHKKTDNIIFLLTPNIDYGELNEDRTPKNLEQFKQINYNFDGENYLIIIAKDVFASIDHKIQIIFERIGRHKLPNKKLKLVISLNFADWFLASTNENWGSCLDLESDYESAYWTGLPGLIGDKNRALVYITNGEKKKYHGIVVDKFLTRSWLLTVRTKIDDKKFKTKFSLVKEYPMRFGVEDFLEKELKMDMVGDEYFISRYYVELFYFRTLNGIVSTSIYQDNVCSYMARKNKARYMQGHYCYYKSGGPSAYYFNFFDHDRYEGDPIYYTDGLGYLISEGISLKDAMEDLEEEEAASW